MIAECDITIKLGSKTKTFYDENALNMFIGAGPYDKEFHHTPVSTYTFYKIRNKYSNATIFRWDDYTDMTAEDWVYCTKEILKMEIQFRL